MEDDIVAAASFGGEGVGNEQEVEYEGAGTSVKGSLSGFRFFASDRHSEADAKRRQHSDGDVADTCPSEAGDGWSFADEVFCKLKDAKTDEQGNDEADRMVELVANEGV